MEFKDILFLLLCFSEADSAMAQPQRPLQVPDITKSTHSGGNTVLAYASSAMQGYRSTMEDAVSNLPVFCRRNGGLACN